MQKQDKKGHLYLSLNEMREEFCIYSWSLVKILFIDFWLLCNVEFHFHST